MRQLTAAKISSAVMLSFVNADGDTCCITLHKVRGKWVCPTMTYTKITSAQFVAAFGLKNGWEPNKKMIAAADKALKNG